MSEELTIDQLFAEPMTKPDNQEPKTPEPGTEVDNLEKTTPDASTPEAAEPKEVTPVEVVPYTPEELKSIPIERLDATRIPETARPYYEAGLREKKGLQAEFTRRSQELAELKNGVAPRNIEEAFDRDPQGVLGRVGHEIDRRELYLASLDPFADVEQSKQVRTEIARLRSLDRDLNQRAVQTNQMMQQANAIVNDTMSTVRTVIKDYDVKRPELEKFAINNLGYTEQEIGVMTDPRIVGKEMAIKNFKAVNALYDKVNAGKTAEKKIVKPVPNKLERDTTPLSSEKPNIEDMSFSELDKHLTKLGV